MPCRIWKPWSSMDFMPPPPTSEKHRMFMNLQNVTASSKIWLASSRVGARISASGPSPAVSRVIGKMSAGFFEMYTSIGRTNAAVLPEPVWAMPTTSRFIRPSGMHCIWIAEGALYPLAEIASRISAGSPDSSQFLMGLQVLPPLVAIWKSSRKMRQSRTVISSKAFSVQCAPGSRIALSVLALSRVAYASFMRLFASASSLFCSSSFSMCDCSSSILERTASRFSTYVDTFFCSRMSMPARSPRPKRSWASCFLLYSGFASALVSSEASQSNAKRNLSVTLTTFFLTFPSPRYRAFTFCISFSVMTGPVPSLVVSGAVSPFRSRSRCRIRSRSRARSLSRSRSRLEPWLSARTSSISLSRLRLASSCFWICSLRCSSNRSSACCWRCALVRKVGFEALSWVSLSPLSLSSSETGSTVLLLALGGPISASTRYGFTARGANLTDTLRALSESFFLVSSSAFRFSANAARSSFEGHDSGIAARFACAAAARSACCSMTLLGSSSLAGSLSRSLPLSRSLSEGLSLSRSRSRSPPLSRSFRSLSLSLSLSRERSLLLDRPMLAG
mmetsp:Transcript_22435/g.51762  ORF Transcript_22435/g.51762 Transcript_22435/m.51762 type:complete len:562 (+) Transcript_22435:1017-2702(+)